MVIVLIVGISILVVIFSNRVVRPIEKLVSSMRSLQEGGKAEILIEDAPLELEYLIRVYQEMVESVEKSQSELERRLGELSDANLEIRQTQSQLVQSAKMASLGQVVAGVAHELNNPIGYIYSNMHQLSEYVVRLRQMFEAYQRALDRLPEGERAEAKKLEKDLEIEFILRDIGELSKSCLDGATRAKDIVMGLRTFSRVNDTDKAPVDIHEGIKSTLKLLESEFKSRITVHEDYAEIPPVECHLTQINQVLMNLLFNASQAISKKGEIWIKTFRHDNFVVIEIKDSGEGIPAETLEKIFDPFFTTKRLGQGTGLGLSIAYNIVEQHGGKIEVESTVGKGALFRVSLPLHRPPTHTSLESKL